MRARGGSIRFAGIMLAACLLGSWTAGGQAPGAPDPWPGIHAYVTAPPGPERLQPPRFRDLIAAIDARLPQALRARVEGRAAAAESAFADCALAAGLCDRYYRSPVQAELVRRYAAFAPEQTGRALRADSLRTASRDRVRAQDVAGARADLVRAQEIFRALGDERGARLISHQLLIPPLTELDPSAQAAMLSRELRAARADDPMVRMRLMNALERVRMKGPPQDSMLVLQARIRALGDSLRDPTARFWGWYDTGWTLRHLGRRGEAMAPFRAALAGAAATGDSLLVLYALQSISGAFYEQEQLDSSTAYSRRCVGLAERLGNQRAKVGELYNLCLNLWYLHRPEEALDYCEQCERLARDLGNWELREQSLNIMGNIFADNGNWEQAMPIHQEALAIAREHDDPVMKCYLLRNIGLHMLDADSLTAARRYFEQSLAVWDSIPAEEQGDWDLKGALLGTLGWMALGAGDTTRARQLIRESYALALTATQSRRLGICWAGLQLADLQRERGELAAADSLYRQVIEAGRTIGEKPTTWIARAGLAEIAWRRGERDAAIAEMEQAAGEIEAYREKIGSLGSRERWFASALSPFQSLIRYAIELGQDQRAFAVFERMKARELLDLLEGGHVIGSEALTAEERDEEDRLRSRSAELNRRITGGAKELEAELEQSRLEYQSFEGRLFRVHPELRERRGRGEPITAREAQRMLAPDEVALLYTLGDETATLLAVTREGIRGYLLPTPAPIIRRRIELFNASIQAWSARFDRDRASDLFRAVIEPAREQLQGKRRICFVPDAELYAIPLQALIDPSSGSYLIESYSVYITPSLSALGALRWKGSRGRRDLLAVGDPQFGVPGGPVAMTLRGALGPLPFTRSEVEEIAQVYAPRARVLVGAAATETAFKTLAGDYGVLHLASHGSLDDGNPLYSSIAFSTPAPAEDDTTASSGPSGARGPTDDGFLEAWEVMELSLDADIVVLSACETARGTITRGEGINGLLRAFFVAGVPTVVASLWKVEDRSTALLMSEFHRRLRDGERPADALAAAERTLLDGEFLLRHPYYWAGFLLYGDSE